MPRVPYQAVSTPGLSEPEHAGATKGRCMHGMRSRGAQDRGTQGHETLDTDMLRTARHYFLLLTVLAWVLAPRPLLWLSGRFIINSLSYSRSIERSCRQDSSQFGFPEAETVHAVVGSIIHIMRPQSGDTQAAIPGATS